MLVRSCLAQFRLSATALLEAVESMLVQGRPNLGTSPAELAGATLRVFSVVGLSTDQAMTGPCKVLQSCMDSR